MYLSLNWLKEFVKFQQTPEKVAEIFTLGGFEVEQAVHHGAHLDGIVVGQIKTIVNHAEADKLSVCRVDVGRKEPLTIVCGARNIKPAQHVPVALVGAVLPGGMKIERRRIRGIDSEGMLCAEDELGLGDDHSGIMILDKSIRVGAKFTQAIKLDDTVLDISVAPNRPDGFSVLGLAREFAALSGQKLMRKKVNVPESAKFNIKKLLAVSVKDYELCPRYVARVVKNVKVGPSPLWLQSRLRVCGVKPINNIVDSTNYVMLEYGQPLHAFDLANVSGKKVTVRKAGTDTLFQTLDGERRTLPSDALVIADAQKPIAVAGVMGGENSEITKQTKDVVIESAIFKPLSIRKTRQKLGIVTEASARFEKGIWWDLPEEAADRAAQLMHDLAGGEIASGTIVASKEKGRKPTVILLEADYVSKHIGKTFTEADIAKKLSQLQFQVVKKKKGVLAVTVPSWRQDVSIPADLIEEVGRMSGWNKLTPSPVYGALQPVLVPPEKHWERVIKDALVSASMQEMLNYSFYGERLISQFGLKEKDHYRVTNPLNPDQQYLRTTLLPQLYENVVKNSRERDSVRVFEVGNVFIRSGSPMPKEVMRIAGIVYARKSQGGGSALMAAIKAVLGMLFARMHIQEGAVRFEALNGNAGSGNIIISGKTVGCYGLLSVGVKKLDQAPAWFGLTLSKLVQHAKHAPQYEEISAYPAIERDSTFWTPDCTRYDDIVQTVRSVDPLIAGVRGLGLFTAGDGRVSATIRVTYRSAERTLTAEEAGSIEQKVIGTLQEKLNMEFKK
ncbi:MAG: phenylalanine--tRNA ligase subunit beta [Patescibacteria group bacterium]